jgi:hypothetical protein
MCTNRTLLRLPPFRGNARRGLRCIKLGAQKQPPLYIMRCMHAGLMAHHARVLEGERTIRMHYANCATFNADFDGDEINLHLPQTPLSRAEAYNIVHADHQFKARFPLPQGGLAALRSVNHYPPCMYCMHASSCY